MEEEDVDRVEDARMVKGESGGVRCRWGGGNQTGLRRGAE